jgi:cytochrome c oxidase subunit 1
MIKPFTFLDLKKRPYELLGIMALLLFLVSFVPSNSSLDINMHDAYFVIANVNLCRIASGTFLFLWSMNILFRQYLVSDRLNRLYVAGTILSLLVTAIIFIPFKQSMNVPRRYYAFDEFEKMRSWYSYNTVITICFIMGLLLFTVSQVVFIINVITGVLRKVSRPDPSNQQ